MTRGVDDVDAMVPPKTGCGSRRDGDAALLFLLHPIHGGGAIMDFTNFVATASIEQNTFCGRGLTGVDMRHNTDIAVITKLLVACHE